MALVRPYELIPINSFDISNFNNLMFKTKSGRYAIRFADGEKLSGRNESELWNKYAKRVKIWRTLLQIRYEKYIEQFDDYFGLIDQLGYGLVAAHCIV